MNRSRSTIGLLLLCGAALGLRIWVVSLLFAEQAAPGCEHGQIAGQAPFYPMLLAAAYWCFGVATPGAILAVGLLQSLAGAAVVLAVAWLAWSLVPDRPSVGWVAAAGAAIYPPHLDAAARLEVTVWAALVLTSLLAVCVSPRWRASRGGAILAGCLAGILLLVEPILALALPICAAAFWMADGDGTLRGRFARRPLARLALMAAVAAVIIAPWTVRNWMVHGRPVLGSTLGYAFWQGNNPIGRPADDTLRGPGAYGEFAGLSEPDRSALLGRRAWRLVRENPAQYARLCLRRLQYFLLFDQTGPEAVNRLWRISSVTWLVLAFLGLSISCGRWRALWPTYAIFATVMLFHVLVTVSARSRIAVEPMTFVWASAALAPLVVRLLPRRPVRVYRPGEHPRDPLGREHLLKGPHYDLPARRRAG